MTGPVNLISLEALAGLVMMESRHARTPALSALFTESAVRLRRMESQAWQGDFGAAEDGTPLTLVDAYNHAQAPIGEAISAAKMEKDEAGAEAARGLLTDFARNKNQILTALEKAHGPGVLPVPLTAPMLLTHPVPAPPTAHFRRETP
ncbi:MAG TPA: hypothetical protein VEF76_07155 [Patescibacteria group bacterium]|nr:hypothetical protein [Patescibacteria group bacterium]